MISLYKLKLKSWEMKLSKKEGCPKISYEMGLFQKSFAGITRPLVTNISQEQRQGVLSSWFWQAYGSSPSK